jgi:ribonuclease P protein component
VRGTLKTSSDFEAVYTRGTKAVGTYMVLFGLTGEASGDSPAASPRPVSSSRSAQKLASLVGIVASRKVGRAVVRNRAKRLLRSAFSSLRPELPVGCRVILVARRSMAERRPRCPAVVKELRELLEQIGLLDEALAPGNSAEAAAPDSS